MLPSLRRTLVLVLFGAALAAPAEGFAQSAEWRPEWRRARPMEVGITGTALGFGAAMNFWWPHPHDANWQRPILLDAPLGDPLRAETAGPARTAATMSDVFATTNIVWPFADAALAATARDAPVTGLQTAAMGVESFGTALLTTTVLKFTVARQRPPTDDCGARSGFDNYCTHERNVSFPSGHTTLAFTGAGLTCALHEHIPLYSNRWADRSACWGALTMAAGTGVARVVSGNHYPTDVLAGTAIGLGAGYLLPKLLHFGFGGNADGGDETARRELRSPPTRRPTPMVLSYGSQF